MFAFHDLLHGERRRDVQRHARVVPFAVAWRALDQRIVVRDARLLRRLRDAVDVGAERQDWLARPPACHPRGRNAGDPFLHGEAVLLQDPREVFRRFDLLEPELAEAEHLIDHLLRELARAVDLGSEILLVLIELRVRSRLRRSLRWPWARRRRLCRRRRERHRDGGGRRNDPDAPGMHEASYQKVTLAPIRRIRGGTIVVGRWKARMVTPSLRTKVPEFQLMFCSGFALKTLKRSMNGDRRLPPSRVNAFSRRRSSRVILSCRRRLIGSAIIRTLP